MSRWGKVNSREIRKLHKKVQKFYKVDHAKLQVSILKELAQRHYRRVKLNTPVGITHELKKTWTIGDVLGYGRNKSIAIYNNKFYAAYVEFGHRRHRSMMGKGPKWVEGQYFMTSAEKILKKLAPRLIDQRMKEAFSEVMNGK